MLSEKKEQAIKANYHTHTKRCHHARGEDREYVEAAIEAGLQILGFSDHTPYPVREGFVSGMRISLDEADDYFYSISSLKKEYAKDIKIHIGVEAEYFPEHFHKLLDFMKDYPLEYMILGEHFVPEEERGRYLGAPFTDVALLEEYTKDVIEAIHTGKFLYVAHPDLPNYVGEDKDQKITDAMEQICAAAKQANLPLEINMLGHVRGGQYPSDYLLKAAAKYGNDMIIGMDVHNPKHFYNPKAIDECIGMAERYHLNLLTCLPALGDELNVG